ncbi:unnamed protein product [Oppiella nova]|uniref:Uncharacterized protein n=1 Tax=Oppiella nova TaxID=334625 RepID=A0A7R9M7B1_9ACAR|nr:unnamed protein product [Oppiella nova]CAG2170922.1 unnamed protein product [Oppiella nova]
MGCAITKFHRRLIESTKGISSVNIEIVDIHNLNSYFTDEDNPNPKCIFIFGGSGSNKGEFIWELLQLNETIADSDAGETYTYHYIDVEKLILDNIAKRIKKLTSEKTTMLSNPVTNVDEFGQNGHELCLSEATICLNTSSSDDLKTKLLLYANIITTNWVLSLITKEIDKLSVDSKERVFIINLIPNRINMFRNCLFLKQVPSFVNFHFNYIAINLIKNTSKRKDLDQMTNNCGYDEVNNLLSFIYSPKKDGMEIDINGLNLNKSNKLQNGLMFMISNEIEIDENLVFVFDENNFSVETSKLLYI